MTNFEELTSQNRFKTLYNTVFLVILFSLNYCLFNLICFLNMQVKQNEVVLWNLEYILLFSLSPSLPSHNFAFRPNFIPNRWPNIYFRMHNWRRILFGRGERGGGTHTHAFVFRSYNKVKLIYCIWNTICLATGTPTFKLNCTEYLFWKKVGQYQIVFFFRRRQVPS